MKLYLRLLSCFLLCAVLLCSSPFASALAETGGSYSCFEISYKGESFMPGEVFSGECAISFDEDGQGTLVLDGSTFPCLLQRDGEGLCLSAGGKTYPARLDGGLISIEMDDMVFSFLRAGADIPAPGEPQADDGAQNGGLALWNGDWYGKWRIFNASGDWTEFDGLSYDCFARILVRDDERGSIVLWDEKLSGSEPMAELEISIVGSSGDIMGAAMVEGGWFWQMEPVSGTWGFGSNIAGFDRLIALENAHYESAEGSFDFTLLLRPWGYSWEDVAEIDPASLPSGHYDWYLPLIEAGQPMPYSEK